MNEKLFHFDMAESDKCAFCQPEVESIYLFFLNLFIYSFKISSDFREHVLSWLRDNNIIVVKLKEEDIISDTFDVGDDLLNRLGSTIFIYNNVRRVCPPFTGSLLGLGVFILPGKEAH